MRVCHCNWVCCVSSRLLVANRKEFKVGVVGNRLFVYKRKDHKQYWSYCEGLLPYKERVASCGKRSLTWAGKTRFGSFLVGIDLIRMLFTIGSLEGVLWLVVIVEVWHVEQCIGKGGVCNRSWRSGIVKLYVNFLWFFFSIWRGLADFARNCSIHVLTNPDLNHDLDKIR